MQVDTALKTHASLIVLPLNQMEPLTMKLAIANLTPSAIQTIAQPQTCVNLLATPTSLLEHLMTMDVTARPALIAILLFVHPISVFLLVEDLLISWRDVIAHREQSVNLTIAHQVICVSHLAMQPNLLEHHTMSNVIVKLLQTVNQATAHHLIPVNQTALPLNPLEHHTTMVATARPPLTVALEFAQIIYVIQHAQEMVLMLRAAIAHSPANA